jgi:hypothetical protein
MTYSKWTDSIWYTFANTKGGLTVCVGQDYKTFKEHELENIDHCIGYFRLKNYTEEELNELRNYMNKHKENSFVKQGELV